MTAPRILIAVVAVVVALAGAGVAGAAVDQKFTDVPADHPFAFDIGWMASAGISEGYDDGTYKPDEPLTRQAMAAFLHRFAQSFTMELETREIAPEWDPLMATWRVPPLVDVTCETHGMALNGGTTDTRGLLVNGHPDGTHWLWDIDPEVAGPLLELGASTTVDVWALCGPHVVP